MMKNADAFIFYLIFVLLCFILMYLIGFWQAF